MPLSLYKMFRFFTLLVLVGVFSFSSYSQANKKPEPAENKQTNELDEFIRKTYLMANDIVEKDGKYYNSEGIPVEGIYINTAEEVSAPVSIDEQESKQNEIVIGKPEDEESSSGEPKKGVVQSLKEFIKGDENAEPEGRQAPGISLAPPIIIEEGGDPLSKEEGGVNTFLKEAQKKQAKREGKAGVGGGGEYALYWQMVRKEYMRKREERKRAEELAQQKEREKLEASEFGRFIPHKKPDHSYRTVRLSPVISKKFYNKENSHLPAVVYEDEYKKILFESVASGNIDVMRAMIKRFGTTEVRDSQGNTPLLYAITINNVHAANVLLGMDAAVDAQNYVGLTPLLASIAMARVDYAQALLKRGADPDLADNKGVTPLMFAAEDDHVEIAQLLVKYGADINKRLKNGDTALHFAAIYNSASVAYFLVTKSVALEMRNFKGYTPVMLAALSGSSYVADILIKAGADLEKTDALGRNSVDLAGFKNHHALAGAIEGERIRLKMLASAISSEKDNSQSKDALYKAVRGKNGIPIPKEKPLVKKSIPKPYFSRRQQQQMKLTN